MVSKALLKEHGFKEEIAETAMGEFNATGFPESVVRYVLSYEITDLSVEEPYFWVLDSLKEFIPIIDKVEDAFSASENSAFFGVTQQRLGIQQDKISQFLATVGKMVKELFQMVRELRILDERLTYYNESLKDLHKEPGQRSKPSEITLKGIFIDLVQGGGKNPASIYGMSRELEFITLPDLFFDAPPFKTLEEMEAYVKGLEENFNMAVLRVLTRHLRQFMEWKKRTHKEHSNRRGFMLRYLKQHYDIIQMYIVWLKPYLRTVRTLSMKETHQDSPEIISSFEGSMMDIELLAHHPQKTHCLLVTFNYRTRPHMKFVQEGYQRGPLHVGRMTMTVRVFDWKKKQIKKYKEMKEKESFELLGDVSASVKASMEGLGKELKNYLKEAKGLNLGEKEEKKEEVKEKPDILKKVLGDFINFDKIEARSKAKAAGKTEKDPDEGLEDGTFAFLVPAWSTFRNFKKSHRMVTW